MAHLSDREKYLAFYDICPHEYRKQILEFSQRFYENTVIGNIQDAVTLLGENRLDELVVLGKRCPYQSGFEKTEETKE